MRRYLSVTLLLTQLFYLPSFAINEAVEALVMFETRANAVAKRSHRPVAMPHFEIPLDMLEVDFAERFNPEHRKHLIFRKKGKDYVRWILNPEDTKWHLELAKHFKSKGLSLEKKYYFTGYQTASRSYVVEDPKQEVRFSAKSSTDTTGGHWADKPQHVDDAIESRKNADLLHDIQRHLKFDHIIVMDEPAILKAKGADQAIVIRDLGEIQHEKNAKIYLPGFSALHDKVGKEIALLNGSKDPFAFWTEHYVKATGRALGELAARTGLQLDSPHSQNFLIELTTDYKPTGRIVIRDMADFYINRPYMERLRPDHLVGYTPKSILNHIDTGFGPLHGNSFPDWISEAKYSSWLNVFYREFNKSFYRISGLKRGMVQESGATQNRMYFSNDYMISEAKTPQLNQFWENLKKYKSPRGILNCSAVLIVSH